MSTATGSPFATALPSLARGHRVESHPMSAEPARRTDEQLVEAVARADEHALGELYDRFGKVAYGLAYKILQDANLAEDAVQEAFLQIWRGAGSYRPERAKASTWLLTYVHRRAVDLVRREQRRRTVQLDPLPEPSGSGADEEVVARSRREIVQDALRRLPPEQREAIELAYYGGLTQSELADRLEQPLGTIKSRMFTGLQRLRVLLVEAGYDTA
jgi:RNA polymerase sigma-70 factor, ECF subfamily